MCPSERRDVGEEIGRAVEPGLSAGGDGMAEMQGVPVDHDGCEKVRTHTA